MRHYTTEFDTSVPSAWAGHYQFAYDLVRHFKPSIIVELGSYAGGSLFAMCQAVQDEKYQAYIHAIDTWQGDAHSGLYSNEVYESVLKTVSTKFQNLSIGLHRMTFDEAVKVYPDYSIDLLHIDGYHTYEAVKHDWETWLRKVSTTGIVLFHDIAVKEGDFGVYKFWDEIKNDYKHYEFYHSYGLGVIFMNAEMFWQLQQVNAFNKYHA